MSELKTWREFNMAVWGTPQPAGSKRHVGGGRIVDSNPKSSAWKKQVAQVAGEMRDGMPLIRGPIDMELVFFRTRPASHYGKKGLLPSAPRHPTTKPDVLKLARGVEDALTGVVYADDSLIVRERLTKEYAERDGVRISLREVL